ncbi:MAG TPA: DUF4097 family beta strand repeat-containing protein [Longimicrobium sp.]
MRVGTLALTAALVAAGAGTARAQQQVNATRSTGSTGRVEIHNPSGSIHVIGWGQNQVQVTGTLGSSSERLVLEDDDAGLEVRVQRPGGHGSNRGGSLTIRVPRRKDVEIVSMSGSVTVEGMDGTVEATSHSGGVRVSGGRSRTIMATSRSGSVDVDADAERVEATSLSGSVTVAGTVRDRVEATSLSGGVRITAQAGQVEAGSTSGTVEIASMRGRAEVHSVSGDVRVTGRGLSGSFQTVSGSVILTGDLDRDADLELNSHSGNVVLQLSSGASADIDAGTFSGSIDVDYPGARVERESRRSARIRLGSGDATVKMQTFSGSVKLVRR